MSKRLGVSTYIELASCAVAQLMFNAANSNVSKQIFHTWCTIVGRFDTLIAAKVLLSFEIHKKISRFFLVSMKRNRGAKDECKACDEIGW